VRLLIIPKRSHLRYGNNNNTKYKYQIGLMTSNVIISQADIAQYSKMIVLIHFPEVINSTIGNAYSK